MKKSVVIEANCNNAEKPYVFQAANMWADKKNDALLFSNSLSALKNEIRFRKWQYAYITRNDEKEFYTGNGNWSITIPYKPRYQ